MNNKAGDILQCEKQLRDALHSDDKEKLRRKLALLKREYVKTAQRLQRAERLEAVRKHVRSRISEQNQLDHHSGSEDATASRVNSPSLILSTTNAEDQGSAQAQEHDPPDSDPSRRSQVIRFILPSESSPQPPDSCHDSGRGHRPSSALRLRSRRSRLRWERRSAEADHSAGVNLKAPEPSESIQGAITAEEEETVNWRGADTVNESEEKLSGQDSDSPSLLLTHWSAHKKAENGEEEKTENWKRQEKREDKTDVVRESPCEYLSSTEGGRLSVENREEGGVRKDEEEKKTCKGEENKKAEQTETVEDEKKFEKSQTSGDEKSLLDSCTLVEGLLFPVEYYVRTTRRMTSSQSQPDIQAVLFSQLSVGRQRRSRGRRSGTCSSSQRRTPSSPATSSTPPLPLNPSVVQPDSASAGDSLMASYAGLSPTVKPACPQRGRNKRRGRGRGRPQTPKYSIKCQDPQVVVTPDNVTSLYSLSQSLSRADGPNPIFISQKGVKEIDINPPVSASITASSQSSSGVAAVQSGSVSAQVEQVYPIFMKHSFKRKTPQQTIRGPSDWTSLLLPPASSPVQTPLLSLPPTSLCSLVGSLKSVDIHQDFHLPDEHFASLKLHKLRQVAVESGVEHFSTPSRNTRSSLRRSDFSDSWTTVPLLPTSSPTAAEMPLSDEKHKAADLPSFLPHCSENLTETLSSSSFTKEQTEGVENFEKVMVVVMQEIPEEPETIAAQVNIQCSLSAGNIHRSPTTDQMVPHPKISDPQTRSEQVSSEEQADDRGEGGAVQDQRSVAPEEKSRAEIQNFDWCGKEIPEEPPNTSTCSQDDEDEGEAAVNVQNALDPLDSKEPHLNLCEEKLPENKPMCATQLPDLLLTSHIPSAPCPFLSPRLPSTLLSSPALPSLGLTPHPAAGSLPLTLSPSAPSLSLPPPHSPSAQALPPPALSPCPSFPIESAVCPPLPCAQRHSSGSPTPTETPTMRRTLTLKAAAGGLLVDVCCFLRASGDLCVAAAGKWAVCLWSQSSASDWSLKHTWTFSEPVINVFPVLDAAGLICVTLGQLEIREVRVLSCSSLMQMLICEGVIQVVVGVSRSRVVTSSCSTMGSTLQVFALSDSSRSQRGQPLESPGVCVSALAPVDGLPDALIATDEDGRLFIWNTKTGQLLCKVQLEQSLSHSACLRGFSVSGALLVLLQHQHLSLPQEEDKTNLREDTPSEEPEMALFSLVATNPQTGRSVLVTQLTPPNAWHSRLFEADVNHSRVAALSPSGGVCVWGLGRGGGPQTLKAPEGEDWQLARWGEEDTLVIGHQNGDVSLYCCSADPTSSCL
ncbi:partner and localizer of BRCA2 [Oryzias latipes]|uniref:Partner and localiser of BRCA2 WD40 domain-containing protein n=1 Tax=Oryzias latipes TaxID=8090 RepID=A0A3B3IJG8_ORYLA|nr:partner and localizer of BRCA2 [Oryzias latipes]